MTKMKTRQPPPARSSATEHRSNAMRWAAPTGGSSAASQTPVAAGGAPPGGDLLRTSVASTAFALGWQLAELDLRAQSTVARSAALRHPRGGTAAETADDGVLDALGADLASPETAATLSDAASNRSDRAVGADGDLASLLDLAQLAPGSVVLPLLVARLRRLGEVLPGEALPSIEALRTAYTVDSDGCGHRVRHCVINLHQEIASLLNAADGRLAMTYDLGRRLAYTTQSSDCVLRLADRRVHDEVSETLADLSVALPPHSARAVQLSLAAWHEWLSVITTAPEAADRAGDGGRWASRRQWAAHRADRAAERVKTLRLDPSSRPLWRVGSRPRPEAIDDPEQITLAEYLKRQGLVWRALLAGEKDAKSMLDLSNYETAAHQFFRRAGKLVCRMAWTNKWAVLLVLALVAAGLYAVVALSGTAKVLTFGTAVLGVLGVSAKSAGMAAQRLLTTIGTELWGAEVDIATAEAITRLPKGEDAGLRFEVLSEQHRAPGPAKATSLSV